MKVDLAETWWKSSAVWAVLVAVVFGTLFYSKTEGAIAHLDNGQDDIIKTVESLRSDLHNFAMAHVSTKELAAWLALLKANNPNLVIPDIPR